MSDYIDELLSPPPPNPFELWSNFERFLWTCSDKVVRHKLNKREFTFLFKEPLTFRTAIDYGTRIVLPFTYHSTIDGGHYICINYDFITARLYELRIREFEKPPL